MDWERALCLEVVKLGVSLVQVRARETVLAVVRVLALERLLAVVMEMEEVKPQDLMVERVMGKGQVQGTDLDLVW